MRKNARTDRGMDNEQVACGGGCEQGIYIGKLQTWEKKPFGEHTQVKGSPARNGRRSLIGNGCCVRSR